MTDIDHSHIDRLSEVEVQDARVEVDSEGRELWPRHVRLIVRDSQGQVVRDRVDRHVVAGYVRHDRPVGRQKDGLPVDGQRRLRLDLVKVVGPCRPGGGTPSETQMLTG